MDFTVESDQCVLHGHCIGSGPVLLLIHGIACDSSHFSRAAEYLAESCRVITYDRRGYSDSQAAPDASYSVRAQALDALRILDHFGCRSASVAASSAGGIVALELARNYPERVEKLFLHETPLAPNAQVQFLLDDWRGHLKKSAEAGRITSSMALLLRAMGGHDRAAKPVTSAQMARNMENLKVFLSHEMDDFLTYSRHAGRIQLSMPCIASSGEMDREGLFSRYMPDVARLLGCSYLQAPGYHNFAWDLPFSYAITLKGALHYMDTHGKC